MEKAASPWTFSTDYIPHSWLFPKTQGVIHHGGVGTTASVLKAGKPRIVCPFTADQPFWANRLKEVGVATAPIKQKEMSVELFTARIEELCKSQRLQTNASVISLQLSKEKGVESTIQFIEEYLPSYNLLT